MIPKQIEDSLTPTQRAILEVLSDGKLHKPADLIAVLPNDQADKNNLKPHLAAIRKLLRIIGHDIVCQHRGKYLEGEYMHVLLLPSRSGN